MYREFLEKLYDFVVPIADTINLLSLVIITLGFVVGFVRFITIEVGGKQNRYIELQALRRTVGIYIILGLEFMIISDLMDSVLDHSMDKLKILGAIVAIRTVLSYFLGLEMKEAEEEIEEVKKEEAKESQPQAESTSSTTKESPAKSTPVVKNKSKAKK